MVRGAGSLVAIFVFCLLGAGSSPASVVDYKEGNTDIDPTLSTVTYAVKPVGGQNFWWWYINNNLSANTAVCYKYKVDGGAFKALNGANYVAPATNGTGSMPVANASVCEGPVTPGTKGPVGKGLTGLVDGTVATFCAEEWYKDAIIGWQNSLDPERCEIIKADTNAPSISVDLKQGGNPVSITNSPGSVQVAITYSDSLSPPWYRGVAFGNNRLCTVTSGNCNSGNTFNFNSSCSNGSTALSQTFNCAMGTPPGDGSFFQCFAVFDGAVTDDYPAVLVNNFFPVPVFTDDDPVTNPDTFTSTGNYTIGCDSVMVDTAAPNTSITAGPTEGSTISDTTPTFSFSSTEGGSTFQCRINSGTYTACSSPFTTGTLGGGSYTFNVRATDQAGNTDASPAGRGFTISGPADTTPPDTSITAGPAGGSTINDATPEFSFTSTEGGSSFQCRVDSAPFSACTSPHSTGALGNGSHTFDVYSTDPSNNPDSSPASRSFTVSVSGPPDATPPDTSIASGPEEGSTISDATPTLSFSSTEGGSSFECSIDSGAFTTCSSPHTTAALDNGAHTFLVRARDAAGNADDSPAGRAFTVSADSDRTPPQTKIKSKPKKSSTRRLARFTFTSSEAESTFTCKLDKAPYRSCGSPFSKKVKFGRHTLSVKARDRAGNTDPTAAAWSWKVKKPSRGR